MNSKGNKSSSNTLKGLYNLKIERDSQKNQENFNKLLSHVLDSEKNAEFQNELEIFFQNINLKEDEISIKDIRQSMFVKVQIGNDRSIDALLRLLSSRLHKINKSDLSENEKIDKFIKDIIGEDNIYLLEEYIKENQSAKLKNTKDWYNFLNNADKKLVFPIISGGMGSMGIFKFFTQGGIDHISNNEEILSIPGIDNIIQAVIIIGVLVLIKKTLKIKIQKNT